MKLCMPDPYAAEPAQYHVAAWTRSWHRLCKLAYLLGHLPQHLALQRVLDATVRPAGPGRFDAIRFKYLRLYLAHGLSFGARRACLLTHYEFCRSVGASHRARLLFEGEMPLWAEYRKGHSLALELHPVSLTFKEGELALHFLLDRKLVAMLTCSVVPGAVFGATAERVLFIGGLQGRPGTREATRLAARLNNEIAPLTMLVLAAQALAGAWGLGGIVGVSAAHQVAAEGHLASAQIRAKAGERKKHYDDVWRAAGGVALAAWGYTLPLDPRVGGQTEPLGTHRTRTRRRRVLRVALYQDILAAARAAAPGRRGSATPPA
jgi:uncharacterized protein VirK/YbjX